MQAPTGQLVNDKSDMLPGGRQSSANGFEQIPEYRATIGYKLLHAAVFAGLVMAVIALNVGWFVAGPSNLREFTEFYNSPFTPVWWAYYIWALIWGLQLIAIMDLFLLTRCGFQSPKKGRVLHAIDVYWIGGWLSIIGWILTTQYPLDNKGALWTGFGFWVAALACFGFSMARMHIFKGWFNLWYYVVYLGSTSICTAWIGVMLMVAILDLMTRYNASYNLLQGFGYGIFSMLVLIGTLLVALKRDFFFAGTIMFATVTIYIGRINYDESNTAITVYMWCMFGILAVSMLFGLVMLVCCDARRAMKNRSDRNAAGEADVEAASLKADPVPAPLAAAAYPTPPAGRPEQFVSSA